MIPDRRGMSGWETLTFAIGALGFVLLITGIALMHVPTALTTAGVLLLLWSYLAARATARCSPDERG